MKKTTLLILLGFFQLSCSSQDLIKISPDLELVKISENAYLHISYTTLRNYGRISANGLIYTDNESAFLFDTPWTDSQTSDLISYLQDHMKLVITGFVPNHWHEDCMGGLKYLKSQGIRSYANQLTIDIAKKKGLPVPDQGFNDSLRLNLGDKLIYCYFLGVAHSTDNIVVWIPSEGILFPGCMCKSLDSDNPGNIADGDISEYPKTIDKVIDKFKSARIVIPGHGSPGGPELLVHTRSILEK
jgi:metallo-beta-lactamase class B